MDKILNAKRGVGYVFLIEISRSVDDTFFHFFSKKIEIRINGKIKHFLKIELSMVRSRIFFPKKIETDISGKNKHFLKNDLSMV